MATSPPIITGQIVRSELQEYSQGSHDLCLSDVNDCLMYDRHGVKTTFQSLFRHKKSIIVFVRNFLCFTCKEYVEDLGKIPRDMLQGFCSLTGYPHEIYVDPERHVYKKLGMRRGETYMENSSKSPHVKSSLLVGSLKSMWRAMTSPLFDFQGDPQQQGGAVIVGPGPKVHFVHFDMNRFDHMPINWLLQLAGLQTLDFSDSTKVIDI